MKNKGIAAIDEYLALWKAKAKGYFLQLRKEYVEQRRMKHPINEETLKALHRQSFRDYKIKREYSDEKVAEILADLNNPNRENQWWAGGEMIDQIQIRIDNHYFNVWRDSKGKGEIVIVGSMEDNDKDGYLERILTKDVAAKKKSLIARIEKKAGTIVDASYLGIGPTGELEGLVEGTLSTVKVWTIGAGGMNIQCFHYRVLVK